MTTAVCGSVLVVDPFAQAEGHLLDDDLMWATYLPRFTRFFGLYSSAESIGRIRLALGPINSSAIELRSLPRWRFLTSFFRLRLTLISAVLPTSRYEHVLFQSFEEISTLLFIFFHRRNTMHLVVTNNLGLDRFARNPWLARWVLRAVFRRAKTIFVHCDYEVRLLHEKLRISREQIVVKPFHQLSVQWPQKKNRVERAGHILFMGPPMKTKPLEPCLQLIRADRDRKYQYVITVADRIPEATHVWLAKQENVQLISGYVPPEKYQSLFLDAAFVLLTHDRSYEGRLSGVFCDAVASGTPVIARPIAPFTEFFDRFGALGLMVEFEGEGWCNAIFDGMESIDRERYQAAAASCRAEACPENIASIVSRAMNRQL
jgi:glycosyltransferase involved in cell wall biosynthesis